MVVDSNNEKFVSIVEAFRKASEFPILTQPWGVWRSADGLTFVEDVIWERRKDLTGVILSCTTAANAPYVIVTQLVESSEI
jgi:hypothetical protein